MLKKYEGGSLRCIAKLSGNLCSRLETRHRSRCTNATSMGLSIKNGGTPISVKSKEEKCNQMTTAPARTITIEHLALDKTH